MYTYIPCRQTPHRKGSRTHRARAPPSPLGPAARAAPPWPAVSRQSRPTPSARRSRHGRAHSLATKRDNESEHCGLNKIDLDPIDLSMHLGFNLT